MAESDAGADGETLPAQWYHDEAHFQRERRAIFARNWSLIARDEQLPGPGDYVADEVAGCPVFVVRGRGGTVRGARGYLSGAAAAAAAGRSSTRSQGRPQSLPAIGPQGVSVCQD